MDVFIRPANLQGKITPPPSKSIAHRALIIAALAEGILGMQQVKGVQRETSQDIEATINCLEILLGETQDVVELNCGESGSTLRFLIPIAAALGQTTVFQGEGRLAHRPLREYSDILGQGGVLLEFQGERNLPATLRGQLKSGEFYVPGHISSQYITGLLLALPLLQGESVLRLTSQLQSAPYVRLTKNVLKQFGAVIKPIYDANQNPIGWIVPGSQKYRIPQGGFKVEADYSQAAFWLVAQFLGQAIEVEGLTPHSSQGDRAILAILNEMKNWAPGAKGSIDVAQIPDLVPILAVAACQRPGQTVLRNAGRLRFKESDRLVSTCEALQNIGATITEKKDSLIIEGGNKLRGGEIYSHNDHRIAMALAIAALNSRDGVTIRAAEAVNKSYPHFFQELQRLGGDVCVI